MVLYKCNDIKAGYSSQARLDPTPIHTILFDDISSRLFPQGKNKMCGSGWQWRRVRRSKQNTFFAFRHFVFFDRLTMADQTPYLIMMRLRVIITHFGEFKITPKNNNNLWSRVPSSALVLKCRPGWGILFETLSVLYFIVCWIVALNFGLNCWFEFWFELLIEF